MDNIKINLIAPILLNNAIKTNGPKDNTTQNSLPTINHSQSDSSDQMVKLLNVIKASGDTGSIDALQKIKTQVESGEYSADILSLVEHLFQELSVDGDFQ